MHQGTTIHRPSIHNIPTGEKGTTHVQAVIVSILLSREQAKSASIISIKLDNLLRYESKFPDTIPQIKASGMIMHINSNTAYLVSPNARSRITEYYYVSNKAVLYINVPFTII